MRRIASARIHEAAARRHALPPRHWAVLAVACAGAFMTFVDTTIVNIAFPAIHASFPTTPLSSLSWVFNGYNVILAAFLMPAGRLCDVLGRRRLFELGLAGFAVASALCAAAPSAQVLIAGRLVQAAAAAILVPASLSLSLAASGEDRAACTVGAWASAAAIGAAVGMPLGGLLVRVSGWPLVFLVNLPVAAVSLVLSRRLLPESRDQPSTRRPDVAGAALLSLALGSLALGIVKAADWGWGSWRVGVSWIVAAALLGAFIRRSAGHPAPVFDRGVLGRPGVLSANLLTLAGASGYFMYLLANVLFLTGVWHYSPLRAGVATLPSAVIAALVARPAGMFADRRGFALPVLVGGTLWAVGCLLWSLRMGAHPAYLEGFLPGQLITGAGLGMASPIVGAAAVARVPASRLGTGAGVNAAVRQVGAVLGIALGVSIVAQPSAADPVAAFARVWEVAGVLFVALAVAAPILLRTGRRLRSPATSPS